MSGGNKAVELQLQMRQNAEDMISFMRELESWETDIKKKDEDLRSGGLPEEEVCLFLTHPAVLDTVFYLMMPRSQLLVVLMV